MLGKQASAPHIGLIAPSNIPNLDLLRAIADPNIYDQTTTVIPQNEMDLIQQYKINKLRAEINDNTLTKRKRDRAQELLNAINSTTNLKQIVPRLPPVLDTDTEEIHTF